MLKTIIKFLILVIIIVLCLGDRKIIRKQIRYLRNPKNFKKMLGKKLQFFKKPVEKRPTLPKLRKKSKSKK